MRLFFFFFENEDEEEYLHPQHVSEGNYHKRLMLISNKRKLSEFSN